MPGDSHVCTFNPDEGLPELSDVDALLIRTVTKINADTIHTIPSNLQFIGTASAGTDHVDAQWLEGQGVTFGNAAGCNARSVAEYVITGLIEWAELEGRNLSNERVGIVGVGHVGQQVKKLLKDCNMETVCYDPPRQARDANFTSARLDEVLSCDILTLHIPLKSSGRFATHHWLNEDKLKRNKFRLVINAARGGVADEQALLDAKARGDISHLITDVWENEPLFRDQLQKQSFLATPHIAGYSKEAKTRATAMVAGKMCNHFNYSYAGPPEHNWVDEKQVDWPNSKSASSDARSVLREIHPMMTYHAALSKLTNLEPAEKSKKFSALRTNMPYRNEFKHISVPEKLYSRNKIWKKIGLKSYAETSD